MFTTNLLVFIFRYDLIEEKQLNILKSEVLELVTIEGNNEKETDLELMKETFDQYIELEKNGKKSQIGSIVVSMKD